MKIRSFIFLVLWLLAGIHDAWVSDPNEQGDKKKAGSRSSSPISQQADDEDVTPEMMAAHALNQALKEQVENLESQRDVLASNVKKLERELQTQEELYKDAQRKKEDKLKEQAESHEMDLKEKEEKIKRLQRKLNEQLPQLDAENKKVIIENAELRKINIHLNEKDEANSEKIRFLEEEKDRLIQTNKAYQYEDDAKKTAADTEYKKLEKEKLKFRVLCLLLRGLNAELRSRKARDIKKEEHDKEGRQVRVKRAQQTEQLKVLSASIQAQRASAQAKDDKSKEELQARIEGLEKEVAEQKRLLEAYKNKPKIVEVPGSPLSLQLAPASASPSIFFSNSSSGLATPTKLLSPHQILRSQRSASSAPPGGHSLSLADDLAQSSSSSTSAKVTVTPSDTPQTPSPSASATEKDEKNGSAELQRQLTAMTEKNRQAQEQLAQAQKDLEGKEGDLKNKNAELKSLQEKLKAQDEQLKSQKERDDQAADLAQQAKEVEDQRQALEKTRQEVEQRAQGLAQGGADLKREQDALAEARAQVLVDQQALEGDRKRVEAEQKRLADDRRKLDEDREKDRKSFELSQQALVNDQRDLDAEREAVAKDQGNLQKEKDEHQEEVARHGNDVRLYNEQVRLHQQTVRQHNEQVRLHGENVRLHDERVEKHERDTQDLQGQRRAFDNQRRLFNQERDNAQRRAPHAAFVGDAGAGAAPARVENPAPMGFGMLPVNNGGGVVEAYARGFSDGQQTAKTFGGEVIGSAPQNHQGQGSGDGRTLTPSLSHDQNKSEPIQGALEDTHGGDFAPEFHGTHEQELQLAAKMMRLWEERYNRLCEEYEMYSKKIAEERNERQQQANRHWHIVETLKKQERVLKSAVAQKPQLRGENLTLVQMIDQMHAQAVAG